MTCGLRNVLLTRWIFLCTGLLVLGGRAHAATMTFQRGVSPTSSYSAMYDFRVFPTDVASSATNAEVVYLNYPTGARVLAYFDLSSLPAGSSISQATLQYDFFYGSAVQASVGVYRVRTNWRGGTAWQNAGGDWTDKNGINQGTTPFSSVLMKSNAWYSWDVTPIVQAWMNGSAPNYGVILIAGTSAASYGQAYASGHNLKSVHPKLVVTYTTGADALISNC